MKTVQLARLIEEHYETVAHPFTGTSRVMTSPSAADRHAPILRDLHQLARQSVRLDLADLDQPRDRPAVRLTASRRARTYATFARAA